MSAVLPVWLKNSGYRVFTRPNELNLVGFRANSTKPNSFDDTLKVFYWDKNRRYKEYRFDFTTDPGTFWLNQPMNASGTAMLAGGQYIDLWALGMHKGQYEALVQVGECLVYRDYDRDSVLDFLNGSKVRGLYGINLHKAGKGRTLKVDKHSAGCQVFADEAEYWFFITELARRHANLYGRFSYTLIDERAYTRALIRRLGYVSGAAVGFYAASKYLQK